MISRDLPSPGRALVIAAHPDDAELRCGATLAKWAASGCEVSYLICTDGSKGSWEPGEDLQRLVETRAAEQRAAAAALGASGEVAFLGRPDGELASGSAERSEVAAWIRRLRPEVILGHDPWKRYRLHPDHRAAGFLTVDAIVAARDPHFFPEHNLPHHRPEALLLFEADSPDHYEGVVGYAGTKIAAIECHLSQLRTTMQIEPADDGSQRAALHRRIVEELEVAGAMAGMEQAEAFKLMAPL